MQDVCGGMIQISPELNQIFLKHSQRIYLLHWFYAIIRGERSKPFIVDRIVSKYDEYFKDEFYRNGDDDIIMGKLNRLHAAISEFVKDFRRLSFADVELLRLIKFKEFNTSNLDIKTIDKQLINKEVI